jgi:hypothetical protein
MVAIHIRPNRISTTPATPRIILILHLLGRTGHLGLVKDSGSHGLHDHPQSQHGEQSVEQVARPHLGAHTRNLGAENFRHAVQNSDQSQKPGDDSAYPPPHPSHLLVIQQANLYQWFPHGLIHRATRSEVAWDGPSPPHTRQHLAAGAVPAPPGAPERCRPRRAPARCRS